MKDDTQKVQKAGIGRTLQLCQDALIEMLEELSTTGKRGGSLNIIRQDIDVPKDNDENVDTDISVAPYIKVAMTGGEIPNANSPQMVEFSLTICAYDTGTKHDGFRDVANIKEDIIQRVCTRPYFGGAFTILYPIAWAIQQDTSPPYYFAAWVLTCTALALTQDGELKGMFTWLCTIGKNAWLNERRKQTRFVPMENMPQDFAPDLETSLEEREQKAMLRKAILELPTDYQDVVILHIYGGVSLREIAAQ